MSDNQLVQLIRGMEVFCAEKGLVWDVNGIANQVKERLEPVSSHLVFQGPNGKKELVRL